MVASYLTPNMTPLLLLVAGSLHVFSLFLFLSLSPSCSLFPLLSTFLSVITLGKYKITGIFDLGRETWIPYTSNLTLNHPFGQGLFSPLENKCIFPIFPNISKPFMVINHMRSVFLSLLLSLQKKISFKTDFKTFFKTIRFPNF